MVFQNVARVLALIGGGLSAIFVVWSGIQWMMAVGDPQRMAQARNSLIGTAVGIVIIGAGFILPGVIADLIISPSGGLDIGQDDQGVDCDGIFRSRLIVNRSVSTGSRMNELIGHIQGLHDACREEIWNPDVRLDVDDTFVGSTACFDNISFNTIARVPVPQSLRHGVGGLGLFRSGRDAQNNIIIYFHLLTASGSGIPHNGAYCWMYISYYDSWAYGY